MAKEITAGISVSITDVGNTVSGGATFQINFSGNLVSTEITVPTSSTLLSFAPVTAPEILFIKNTDPTNYIELDHVTGFTNWVQKLEAGEAIILHPEDGTVYAKANTASVKIYVVAG